MCSMRFVQQLCCLHYRFDYRFYRDPGADDAPKRCMGAQPAMSRGVTAGEANESETVE
jgi:hypothetical protein